MKTKLMALTLLLTAVNLWAHDITTEADTTLHTIGEVVVTGTRTAQSERYMPQTISIISREQLTAQQRQNILPTLMEQVPGLMLTSRGVMGYGVSTGAAGGMMMRGLSSGAGQMMVLIDGHPQYQGVFGHSIADSYQTIMAERVEVLRGPASMLYGSNGMGGVINIVTRQTSQDEVRSYVNLGAGSYATFQAEVGNQLRKGRFSSTAALQYGRSDNQRPHMGFQQYGGYAKVGYDINSHWNASADLNLTHFAASNPGTVSQPKLENDQWINRGTASLRVQNNYRCTNGAISVYDNFGRHKINDGYNAQGGQPQTDLFRSRDAVAGLSWYQTYLFDLGSSLFQGSITGGLDYQHIYGRAWYTDRVTGDRVTTPKRLMQSAHAHENEVAGYLDYHQNMGAHFSLDAGLRYDHHSTAGGEWVPQVGLVYRPLPKGELKAMASKGFRNPTTKEMYLYGTANHDSLRAERMWNYELSWQQSLAGDRVSYGLNIFYMMGDNLIQTVAGRNVNSGDFENIGAELEAAWHINRHWSLHTNHSYLHMDQPLVAAPTYKGYLGTSMRYGKWSAAAGLQQVCGLYKAVGANQQKETFTLLNATVSYQPIPMVRLYLKGDNLLGQKYEINAGYPMPKATFMAGVNVEF